MAIQRRLMESCNKRAKRRGKRGLPPPGTQGATLAFTTSRGVRAPPRAEAEDKPIHAFLAAGAPPPPPPPPPPPAPSSAPKSTPVLQPVKVEPSFVQPHEIPTELPKVDIPATGAIVDTTPAPTASGGEPGGVPGGVAGGVAGGVVGGVVGGQLGGVPGGVVGGTVGGTGTTEAAPAPPPEPKEEGPLRVGGDVKAPEAIRRTEPRYTETARKAHLAGVVVVEAIIDKNGNVDRVKVLKGLDLGLTEQAVEAVKQWKFR